MRRSSSRQCARPGLNAICAALGALGLLSCGAADHAQVPPTESPDAGTQVASGVNVCPHFEGSLILPQRIRPSESALVAVRVSDPDGDDSQLVFTWSATSGAFSSSDKAVTDYSCSEVGLQQLTFKAQDRQGCSSDMTIAVECISN